MTSRQHIRVPVALNGLRAGDASSVVLPPDASVEDCIARASQALGKPALGTAVLYLGNGIPVSSVDQLRGGDTVYFEPTGQAFVPRREREISTDSASGVRFGDPSSAVQGPPGSPEVNRRRHAPRASPTGWDAPADVDGSLRPVDAPAAEQMASPKAPTGLERDETGALQGVHDPVLHNAGAAQRQVSGDVDGGSPLRVQAKCVMLGASGVGKSSLLLRLLGRPVVDGATVPTVGIDNVFRRFSLGPHSAHLMVWDTAGQEKFRSITRAYFRDAALVIFVFDVASHRSFSAIDRWLRSYRSGAVSDDAVLILVANKMDLPTTTHQVEIARAEQYAREHDMVFFSVSAKFSASIDAIFENGLMEVLARVQQGRLDVEDPASGVAWDTSEPDVGGRGAIDVDSGGQGRRSGCCSS